MTKTEDPTPTAILEQPHRERRSPAAQASSYAGSVFGFFALWLRFAALSLALVAPSTLGRYRRSGIALLLNARITGDSSDATAGSTMQALDCTS
jgi:hypothetical protein